MIKETPLDIIFAKCIKLKIGAEYQEYNSRKYLFGNCEYCGQWEMLQCSHFHSRVRLTTRFDEENVSALCGGCHKNMEEHPDDHNDWFKKRLGSDRFEKLSIRAHMTIKDLPIDQKKLLAYYKKKIKEME